MHVIQLTRAKLSSLYNIIRLMMWSLRVMLLALFPDDQNWRQGRPRNEAIMLPNLVKFSQGLYSILAKYLFTTLQIKSNYYV